MTTDPFAALEQAARRQQAEEDAARQVQKALVKLILGKDAKSPFFATLMLRQRLATNWDIQSACVDGRTLEYNPDFVLSLTLPQTVGLLAHEVMHLAHKHHCRQGGRDHAKWNIATDLEINGICKSVGFTLPPGGLFPGVGQYADLPVGLAAEKYYDLLPEKQKGNQHPDIFQQPGGDGQGQDGEGGDPGQDGRIGRALEIVPPRAIRRNRLS
jgi:hypothetical protein